MGYSGNSIRLERVLRRAMGSKGFYYGRLDILLRPSSIIGDDVSNDERDLVGKDVRVNRDLGKGRRG